MTTASDYSNNPLSHHPNEAVLMDFAAGSAPEPLEHLAATHLAMGPPCRREMASLEDMDGSRIRDLAPEPVNREGRAAVFDRMNMFSSPAQFAYVSSVNIGSLLPALSHVVDELVEDLPWKRGSGIGEEDHSSITDSVEDCLCLAVTDVPLSLTDRFARPPFRLSAFS